MNMQDYEQIELDKSVIGDDVKFLKENKMQSLSY